MSSRQFVLHLFFLGILPPTRTKSRSGTMVGTYFPRDITLVFMWPGKVMSCLAHLAGGPIVIVSFLASLAILPWGNSKTYLISCSWWILCVCKVWPLLEDHANVISKHVCGTPIFNKSIWRTMQNFLCPLSKHRCMGDVKKFLSPYLKGFLLLSNHGYHALLTLGKDIPLKYVFKHIFVSIVLLIW